jgi:hypothetical protein
LTNPRKTAWETRRKKYGPRGHGSNYARVQRACDSCERMMTLIVRLHVEGVLSEGQAARATGLHRIDLRKRADDMSEIADPKYQKSILSESDLGDTRNNGDAMRKLLAAARNLENDDGSIPAHAWGPLQAAIVAAEQSLPHHTDDHDYRRDPCNWPENIR